MESFAKFMAYCTNSLVIFAIFEGGDEDGPAAVEVEGGGGGVMYSTCLATSIFFHLFHKKLIRMINAKFKSNRVQYYTFQQ
mmetsp:Transcript_7245/g.9286  ORF Transcript_7245/g.9286 Transcript_7245/m.9286 type:complete len:81 (-) Transcript_7245:991-1233(-)